MRTLRAALLAPLLLACSAATNPREDAGAEASPADALAQEASSVDAQASLDGLAPLDALLAESSLDAGPCAAENPAGWCGADGFLCNEGRCVSGCSATQPRGFCAGSLLCVGGRCQVSRCGDGVVDRARGEYCDDGNTVDTDACNNACTRACGASCDDGEPCNGAEGCANGVCAPGSPLPDGTVCRTTGKGATCFSGVCVPNP